MKNAIRKFTQISLIMVLLVSCAKGRDMSRFSNISNGISPTGGVSTGDAASASDQALDEENFADILMQLNELFSYNPHFSLVSDIHTKTSCPAVVDQADFDLFSAYAEILQAADSKILSAIQRLEDQYVASNTSSQKKVYSDAMNILANDLSSVRVRVAECADMTIGGSGGSGSSDIEALAQAKLNSLLNAQVFSEHLSKANVYMVPFYGSNYFVNNTDINSKINCPTLVETFMNQAQAICSAVRNIETKVLPGARSDISSALQSNSPDKNSSIEQVKLVAVRAAELLNSMYTQTHQRIPECTKRCTQLGY